MVHIVGLQILSGGKSGDSDDARGELPLKGFKTLWQENKTASADPSGPGFKYGAGRVALSPRIRLFAWPAFSELDTASDALQERIEAEVQPMSQAF
jgi:hypothetical protein